MSHRRSRRLGRQGVGFTCIALAVLVAHALWDERIPVHAPIAEILRAIRVVETGDRQDPPDGDGGLAIGPYQIHEAYWRDAVAHDASVGGTYQDCRDRAYAERVIRAYMQRYAPQAWLDGDAEILARIHNGGPSGFDKSSTEAYWARVHAVLRPAAR